MEGKEEGECGRVVEVEETLMGLAHEDKDR